MATREEMMAFLALEQERNRRRSFENFRDFVRHCWHVVEPANEFTEGFHVDAICDHLQAVAEGHIRDLIINVPPRHSKPCYIKSMVLEKTKGRIELKNVKKGDFVLTHKGRFKKVLAVHEQGVLPLLEITTHSGRSIKLAEDHPLLTTRGWIEARYITVEDTLAEVHAIESCGTNTISEEEARLLGYLVGDGHVKYQCASFTNCTPEVLADFQHCARVVGFDTKLNKLPPSIRNKMPKASVLVLKPQYPLGVKTWQNVKKLGPHPVWSWLEKHNLRFKCSYDKRVPDAIMAGSDSIIKNYLAAYWACDGSISNRKTKFIRKGRLKDSLRSDVRCESVTVSRGLAFDHQHLLKRIGVRSRVRTRVVQLKTRVQGDFYSSYCVSLLSQDDIQKFSSELPLIGYKKINAETHNHRSDFDRILCPDKVASINKIESGECRCLTIKDDESFTIEDIAVHNSTLTSVMFPAWVWIRRPDLRFLYASYAESLSMRDSVSCRRLIESEFYRKEFHIKWRLLNDQNEKKKYENNRTGFRMATSVGGSIMGQGGDFLIVDDPQQVGDMYSETKRQSVINWYNEAFSTRGNNPKTVARVVIMQRLREDDLCGHLLEKGGFEHLVLPAEYEGGTKPTKIGWIDPRTEPGQLLWPDRFGPEEIIKVKTTLGEMAAAGQLQQRPAAASGNIIKKDWLKFYDVAPSVYDEKIITADLSFKGGPTSDFACFQAWCRVGANAYLVDQIHARMDFPAQISALEEISRRHPDAYTKIIEDAANSAALISLMKGKIMGLIAVKPMTSKEARLAAVSPLFEAGNVFLPNPSLYAWVEGLIYELLTFPNAKNDDQLDTCVHALARLSENGASISKLEALSRRW